MSATPARFFEHTELTFPDQNEELHFSDFVNFGRTVKCCKHTEFVKGFVRVALANTLCWSLTVVAVRKIRSARSKLHHLTLSVQSAF